MLTQAPLVTTNLARMQAPVMRDFRLLNMIYKP